MAKKGNTALIGGGLALLALFLIRGSKASASIVTQHGAINNPLNIRTEPKQYAGEIDSPNPAFKSFSSLAYGYAAGITKLHSYFASGYDTLSKIINHWAPESDHNDPVSYIDFIVSNMADPVNPDATFPINDDDQVLTVISLMSDVEQGHNFGASQVAWDAATEAFNLAA